MRIAHRPISPLCVSHSDSQNKSQDTSFLKPVSPPPLAARPVGSDPVYSRKIYTYHVSPAARWRIGFRDPNTVQRTNKTLLY